MKLVATNTAALHIESLPVRGAWVEIASRSAFSSSRIGRSPCGERGLKSVAVVDAVGRCMSLPVRGAWVEIYMRKIALAFYHRRSPCGERGLK